MRLSTQTSETAGDFPEDFAAPGQASESRRQAAEAIAYHRQVVARSPRDPLALGRLAALLLQLGETQEAIGHLGAAVKAMPDEPGLRHMLGAAYLEADDLRSAEIQLRKALKLSPKSAPILRTLGDCCFRAQKAAEAESYYRNAVALAPRDVELRLRLAGLLAYKGAREDARAAYRSLLDEGVKHPLVYAGLIETSHYSGSATQPPEYAAAAEFAENLSAPPAIRRMLHFAIAQNRSRSGPPRR